MVLSFVEMLELLFFVGLRRSAPMSEWHMERSFQVMNLNKTNLYLYC